MFTVVFSPNNKQLLTASADNTAKIWNVTPNYEGILIQEQHSLDVHSIDYSPDGSRIVTVGDEDKANIWNAHTGEKIASVQGDKEQFKFPLQFASYSPDGSTFATSTPEETIMVWDAHSFKLKFILKGFTAKYCSENFIVGLTDDNKGARLWDARDGREVVAVSLIDIADSGATSADCSPDGKHLVTVSGSIDAKDHDIIIWNVATKKIEHVMKGHMNYIVSVNYSPDGSHILTASFDNTAKVWNASTEKLEMTLKGHTNYLSNAVYDPTGERILTSSADGTVKVWNARSGELQFTLPDYNELPASSSFEPNGNSVIVGYRDGKVIKFIMNIDDLMLLAQSRVTRQLDLDEQTQYLRN